MRPVKVDKAIEDLWNVVPIGYGLRFNRLIKYIEKLEAKLRGAGIE